MLRLGIALAAVLIEMAAAAPDPSVGDTVQIISDREMVGKDSGVLSQQSTSSDRDSYVERVLAVRPNGVVLEYDLPQNATTDDRASNWQFPFQVLKARNGEVRLLNAPALVARVDRWLKVAGMPHTVCGKLIFTWNAFRVECDPQSTIRWLATVTLPNGLQAGDPFTDTDAREPTTLRQVSTSRLIATLAIDPALIRRQRAQMDVNVAELTHKVLTLDEALKAHESETVTGTITVTFDLNTAGRTRQRTRVETVQIASPNGHIDTQTVTNTLTRVPLSSTIKL